jgi:hypothetical protein
VTDILERLRRDHWGDKTALDAADEIERLRGLIEAHNQGCLESCNSQAESSRCGAYRSRGRYCPDCPRDWLIDSTADEASAPLSRDA